MDDKLEKLPQNVETKKKKKKRQEKDMLEVRELRDCLRFISIPEGETRTFEKYATIKDKISLKIL